MDWGSPGVRLPQQRRPGPISSAPLPDIALIRHAGSAHLSMSGPNKQGKALIPGAVLCPGPATEPPVSRQQGTSPQPPVSVPLCPF
ncbi:hypothetical protein NDU88_004198 [Pleurodeles waltl]|uniref:Uncharacterized protein n=1 Tax=Pleurodeles waltl TaxID=8319 RepID=A0AAV7WUE0_PLEWA|nr:hypothetical protein NDU88_004198 [Pleurodeles waltl]